MIKKTICSGPAVGFYADSSQLSKLVEEEGGKYVHQDLSSSRRYDQFNQNTIVYHVGNVTLTYKDKGTEKRTTLLEAHGSEEAIGEVEKIIAKTEQQYGLPIKEPDPYRSYAITDTNEVDEATKARWSAQAREWAYQLKEERRNKQDETFLQDGIQMTTVGTIFVFPNKHGLERKEKTPLISVNSILTIAVLL